mgnify:FL=1|tara:strand:+ start:776 stop:1306 length:531 start_codon:yes stop_codon:yes gene_type:complete
MAIPGHTFVRAHFSNSERTTIESFWTDGKTERIEYIEAKEGDANYDNLLTHIDIDSLHEATYKHIKTLNTAFEDSVVRIAKERGLVYDIDSVNSQMYKAIVSAIFTPFDAEKDKERLFMFKLELFEFEKIRLSKNKALKAKLRKTKTMIEALKIAIEIVEKSQTKSRKSSSSQTFD